MNQMHQNDNGLIFELNTIEFQRTFGEQQEAFEQQIRVRIESHEKKIVNIDLQNYQNQLAQFNRVCKPSMTSLFFYLLFVQERDHANDEVQNLRRENQVRQSY